MPCAVCCLTEPPVTLHLSMILTYTCATSTAECTFSPPEVSLENSQISAKARSQWQRLKLKAHRQNKNIESGDFLLCSVQCSPQMLKNAKYPGPHSGSSFWTNRLSFSPLSLCQVKHSWKKTQMSCTSQFTKVWTNRVLCETFTPFMIQNVYRDSYCGNSPGFFAGITVITPLALQI